MVSDPSVNAMNETQWIFELEALNSKDERKFEETKLMADIVKKNVIALLGLDLMPVEEVVGEDPNGEKIVRYRRPEEHEIMPLAAFMGREEVMSAVAKRHEEMQIDQSIELEGVEESSGLSEKAVVETPEDLDALFMDTPIFLEDPEVVRKRAIWNDPQTQQELAAMVIPMDKEADIAELERDVVAPKKKSKVIVE